jgi:hypothetical protein
MFSVICMLCRSLFALMYFFSWPLCCLFSFDIRILIAPLVSKTLLGRVVLSVIKIFITSNSNNNHCHCRGRIVVGLTTNCAIMTITTKVVSSNHAHGEGYSIQHYVIKCISDLRQIDGFLRVLRFPPPIKLIAMI